MRFSLDDQQAVVRDLAGGILAKRCSWGQLRAAPVDERSFSPAVWSDLAGTGLLGLSLPERVGGGGLGVLEASIVLEQIGRFTAPVPYLHSILLAARPLARFGTSQQVAAWMPGVLRGETILTAAIGDAGGTPLEPSTTATKDGGGWRLDGVKDVVPVADRAAAIVVSARLDDGTAGLFVVPTAASGVGVEHQVTTQEGPTHRVVLDGVRAGADEVLVVGDGGAALRQVVAEATVGICATIAGICGAALELISSYTSARSQFGRPIGSFQAVSQRAASAAIDVEAISLSTWAAASLLARGSEASRSIAVAKFWAAEGGQRVLHAALHLHGGVGVDRDYPLHRLYLWSKQLELLLGGASHHLRWLGTDLAAGGVGSDLLLDPID